MTSAGIGGEFSNSVKAVRLCDADDGVEIILDLERVFTKGFSGVTGLSIEVTSRFSELEKD